MEHHIVDDDDNFITSMYNQMKITTIVHQKPDRSQSKTLDIGNLQHSPSVIINDQEPKKTQGLP